MEETIYKQISETSLTDRGLSEYLDSLELSEESLANFRSLILDLGAGTAQDFAREAAAKGFQCRIISVDPRLALKPEVDINVHCQDKSKRIMGRSHPMGGSLAAVSNDLPFPDNCFDMVCAMWSVPFYLHGSSKIERSIKEMLRVVSTDGEVRIYPLFHPQNREVGRILSRIPNIRYLLKKKVDGQLLIIKKGKVKK